MKRKKKSLIVCPSDRVEEVKAGLRNSENCKVWPWFRSKLGHRFDFIYVVYPNAFLLYPPADIRRYEDYINKSLKLALPPDGKLVRMN